MRRRKTAIFFLALGITLSGLAVALNVGWILLNTREVVLLVIGIIFFALIITGLILNTIFLVREIRRNEQHDTFLNSVTHELKTPIASIRLYLETLKSRDLDEAKRAEFYDVMLQDSDRLLNTVEQVLRAGKTKERTNSGDNAVVAIDPLLEEAIAITRSRSNLPDAAIRYTSVPGDLNVKGDREELLSAFLNLLDNAVKYSSDEPKITVKLQTSGFNNRIAVVIRDKGIGIKPAELKRVFKRFYRSDPNQNGAKGTGLGLFIVKSIIEKHGGSVVAESKGAGKGSTFLVQLPRVKQAYSDANSGN
jgi:two-component system, OmpR family, sensor histidine kinase SenX3